MSAASLFPAPKALDESADRLVRAEGMLLLADLLGGVLHELNNPLSVVLGQAAVLKDRLGDGPERAAVDRIVRSADRLAQITRNFVTLAREAPARPLLLPLNGVVEESLAFFAYSMTVRRVRLESNLAAASPSLYIDPREVRLLVASLIGVALEGASAPGEGACLRIETERKAPSGAVLTVSCPGGHLPTDTKPRLVGPSDGPGVPSLFLAAQLARTLGATMTVGVDRVTVDLPSRPPAD
jgi:signal transduction histidine kinase